MYRIHITRLDKPFYESKIRKKITQFLQILFDTCFENMFWEQKKLGTPHDTSFLFLKKKKKKKITSH